MDRHLLVPLLLAGIVGCRGPGAPTAPGTSAVDIGAPIVPYELIELPLPAGTWGEASAINNHGQIVGYGGLPTGAYHALLWQDGNVQDLGTLGGGWSQATDINELGQVVGQSTTGPLWHPFLWSDGVMTDLHPGAPNYNESVYPRVNDAGQVIWNGLAVGESGTRNLPRAWLWSNGVLIDLAGEPSNAAAINQQGQVVGCTVQGRRPFLWENGNLQILPSLGSDACASRINSVGQVVGVSQTTTPTISHAVLWDHGQVTDLGVLPGDSLSTSADITDAGLVVGITFNDRYAGGHPFRWQSGVLLPASPTYQTDPLFVTIASVNEHGMAAGTRRRPGVPAEPAVIENGVTWILPVPEGAIYSRAVDINNRGDVVGVVYDGYSSPRAVLWRRTDPAVAAAPSP
jgi:probable HAF family extracellular repeat protein